LTRLRKRLCNQRLRCCRRATRHLKKNKRSKKYKMLLIKKLLRNKLKSKIKKKKKTKLTEKKQIKLKRLKRVSRLRTKLRNKELLIPGSLRSLLFQSLTDMTGIATGIVTQEVSETLLTELEEFLVSITEFKSNL